MRSKTLKPEKDLLVDNQYSSLWKGRIFWNFHFLVRIRTVSSNRGVSCAESVTVIGWILRWLVREALLPVERSSSNSLAAGHKTLRWLRFIPPCQNIVQGRFIVGAMNELRLMHSKSKNSWLYCGVPQALNNKLSPAIRQRPGWDGLVKPRCHRKQTTMWQECQAADLKASRWLRFIWHAIVSEYGTRPFYGGVRVRIEICATGAKILHPVDIPLLGRLRHQAINFVLPEGKDLGVAPWDQGVIVHKYNYPVRVLWGAVADWSFVVSDCLYIERKGSISGGLSRVWVSKILCCWNRKSLFLIWVIMKYLLIRKRSLQMRPVCSAIRSYPRDDPPN